MVAAVRVGASLRAVARRYQVSPATVQLWLRRAADRPLERVDWSDRPSIPGRVGRTRVDVEDRILDLRRMLREESVLGEYGPAAIHRALDSEPELTGSIPAVRTIARILERRGALDAKRRVRRPAPPAGWYLPDLRRRLVELDSFDVISGLRLKGGLELDILTGISLHGALTVVWPTAGVSGASTVEALGQHWRAVGLPGYAQFDNDTRFIGGNAHPNSIGLVIRYCLAVGVVPVFAPPLEVGFQASIEAFNGQWQRKLWARFDGSDPGRPAGPLGGVHRGVTRALSRADRGSSRAGALPARSSDRSHHAAGWPTRLPASDQRRGQRVGPRPALSGRPALAPPPRPG